MAKKDDPWELRPPIRLDGAGDEVPRPCDLIVCPRCLAVRYIGRVQLEERTKEWTLDKVRGVFCPGCDQLLFTEESWTEHLADRKVYDRQKEAERAKRQGPPHVGAVEVEESAVDSVLTATDEQSDKPERRKGGATTARRRAGKHERVGA